MSGSSPARVKRPIHPMPLFVKKALAEHGLMRAYGARPAYQQNDYVGWITRAKMDATKLKRLHQMLDELARGTRYMNMPYAAKSP